MLMTTDLGQAQFSGMISTMTSAKSIDNCLLKAHFNATHYVHYNTGATAALLEGEKVTGGTSGATARIAEIYVINGTAGSGDVGILLLRDISGTFAAETLTGSSSTGTCAIVQAPIEMISYAPPKTMLITVETASVNITMDGTIPTATAGTNLGHTIASGQSMIIYGIDNIRKFKSINSVDSSGSIIKFTLYF
jgi:hypothetical protein